MPIEVEVDRGEVMGVFHFVENVEFAERTVFPSLVRRLTATVQRFVSAERASVLRSSFASRPFYRLDEVGLAVAAHPAVT